MQIRIKIKFLYKCMGYFNIRFIFSMQFFVKYSKNQFLDNEINIK